MFQTTVFRSLQLAIFLAVVLTSVIGDDNAELDKNILGKYELKSDPKDPYMKKVWMTLGYRKGDIERAQAASDYTVIIEKEGDKYAIIGMEHDNCPADNCKTIKSVFKNGEEHEEERFDGGKYKVTMTFEGNNQIKRTEIHRDLKCENIFIFEAMQFTANWNCHGIKAIQLFKRK